jgi:hypothetical protein
MILLIYLSYLVIALLLAIPFFGLFRSATGNSQLPGSLMNGFDATAIRELLASGGKMFAFYLKAFFPWILIFLLFQIYLNGGILSWVSNPRGKFSINRFHANGRKYFWRFLKLAVYFIIVHLIIGLIIYLPYFLTTGSDSNLTDRQIMNPLFIYIGVHALVLVFIFMWSDLAKSGLYCEDSPKVLKTIFRGLKIAFRRFFSFYLLGLLLLIIPTLAFIGFYLIRSGFVVNTTGLILIVFILQQVLVLIRVLFRTWRLAAVYRYQLKVY